jgi:formylglycine-generating enzyme required for sulfatase activity
MSYCINPTCPAPVKITGEAEYINEDLGKGINLEMIFIPSGSFSMGSDTSKDCRYDYENRQVRSENPIHQVKISPFLMGRYTITQQQYQSIMGDNPSHFRGDSRPVEMISWEDAVKFCQKLSEYTGKQYTLPSESQWEYACRSSTNTPFYFGEDISPDLANYHYHYEQPNYIISHNHSSIGKHQYRGETTDVGSFPPNAFGLYDMHGNVEEWCRDTWHENYNRGDAPTDDKAWIDNYNPYEHPYRGGSWGSVPSYCRSAVRTKGSALLTSNTIGFRVVSFGGYE